MKNQKVFRLSILAIAILMVAVPALRAEAEEDSSINKIV